jgi:glycine/D-amino acid oxidase-like deaminating enzyme
MAEEDRTLWAQLAPPAPATGPLAGDAEAEVAIVGGGFLGLSSALHLAEAGVSVVLVEASRIGYGASGRNTGFVVPSLRSGLGRDALVAKLGPVGGRLFDLAGRSADTVFALAERHGIACDAERSGWIAAAHTPAALERLRNQAAAWEGSGKEVAILDAAALKARTGIVHYHGALFDPAGGQINPLAFARGLAAAAMAKGARIHAGSAATAFAPDGGGWTVTTERGRVKARRLLLATNALVGPLAPAMAASIIPVVAHQVATERLAPAVRDAILIGRPCLADTRRHTFAVRLSPDDRLVTGGLVAGGPGALARAARVFLGRLGRRFPALPPLRAEFVWRGTIATTPDFLPRLFQIGPGAYAAIGCNGRGVAMTTTLGRELAPLLAGAIGPEDLPLPTSQPQPIRAHWLVRHGPQLWLPWSNLRDRLETGLG